MNELYLNDFTLNEVLVWTTIVVVIGIIAGLILGWSIWGF